MRNLNRARELHPVDMRCISRTHLIVALFAGAALCACATQPQIVTDSPGIPAPTAQTPPNESAAAPSPVTAPTTPPAGRAARAPGAPATPPSEQQPMTVTKAREQCWMQAESQRSRDLDTRVKFVEQCVKDKMK
jgi:hypothetical protein